MYYEPINHHLPAQPLATTLSYLYSTFLQSTEPWNVHGLLIGS